MRCATLAFLGLALLFTLNAAAEEMNPGTITGRFLQKGGTPMADALVMLFNEANGPPPAPEKYWRVPDEIVMTDQDGRFTATLPPGNYYVGGLKHRVGAEVSPPRDGDLIVTSSEANGAPRIHPVKMGMNTDMGTVATGAPYRQATAQKSGGGTAIAGKTVGSDGKPVAGLYVFAFRSPSMVGKPIFVSDRTGTDGQFLLRIWEGGGTFYLKARSTYGGGPPNAGDLMGGYGGDKAVPVPVKPGETVKGITITATPFPGQGPLGRQQ